MKIGYFCPYGDLGCGESEARVRYIYLLEKSGHEVVEIDKDGYSFKEKEFAENLDLDFIISHAVIEQKDVVYPDCFTLFFFCLIFNKHIF